MVHMTDWNIVQTQSLEVAPKGNASIYLYHNQLTRPDVMVVVNAYKGIILPLAMLDVKVIPLFL